MKRTTIWIAEGQVERLKQLAKSKGLNNFSELIRRFIDEGIERVERANLRRESSVKKGGG